MYHFLHLLYDLLVFFMNHEMSIHFFQTYYAIWYIKNYVILWMILHSFKNANIFLEPFKLNVVNWRLVSAKLCPIVSTELSLWFPDETDLCPCLDWPVSSDENKCIGLFKLGLFCVDECRKFTLLVVCWWITIKRI